MYTFLMYLYTKQSKRTYASSSTLSGQNGHARFASESEYITKPVRAERGHHKSKSGECSPVDIHFD